MIYELIPNIKNHPIFRGANRNYVNRFFNNENIDIRTFAPNSIAYSSETTERKVAFIISGIARVYSGNSNDPTLLRTLHSGDVFGIANLYSEDELFPSKIVSDCETRILFIEANKFKDFIEDDSLILKNYLSFQSKKIVFLNKKILTFTAGSSERRLAYFIYDNLVDGKFVPPCSMVQLATMLQMGRASLYRAIDALISEQIIQKENKNSFLVDRSKLKNFINQN